MFIEDVGKWIILFFISGSVNWDNFMGNGLVVFGISF